MDQENLSVPEKRRYVRMSTVFPVEIGFFAARGEKTSSLLQGFTRNVSAGGMCLELKSFGKKTEGLLASPDVSLDLTINTTFAKHPIRAVARIAWLKKEETPLPPKYLIGVAYTRIDDKARRRILKHARRLIWVPRVTIAMGLVLLASVAALFVREQSLVRENKALVSRLVESADRKSSVTSELYDLQKRRTELDRELAKASEKISALEASLSALSAENAAQKSAYETELRDYLARQQNLNSELTALRKGKEKLEARYRSIQTEEKLTATGALRQMVDWLRSHQNLKTGLVASFEGDAFLEDWAFTYDQSLSCQVFLLFGDVKRAEAILHFYDERAEKEDGAFFNAYDTVYGRVTERTLHAGPNVWLGLAAVQYEHRLKDGRFLPLAEEIAEWAIRMQDGEGGLKGGPDTTWYSTEHNLDAYAFFNMLYETTSKEKYRTARDRALEWIKKYAYSNREVKVNRGKGDATIATDTFSWSIAAIGPETLAKIGLDPKGIMDFAEEHCEVTVSYKQPGGRTAKARGFDFAKAQNIGRGGVISTEWTAQVVVTFRILADYFKSRGDEDRAVLYADKVNLYLNELQKLIITSPSRTGQGRGCLPYASHDDVDTGHGWRTPKGLKTGSVAGTAYSVFAWTGYNPFDLKSEKEVA